jgi:glutamate N-acetyltransferase / amino-acid N-acetyltransferase
MEIEVIEGGHVTSPKGFSAGAVAASIKKREGALDLGLLVSDRPGPAAGVFTQNLVRSAPVQVSEKRARAGWLQGVVVNSGNANAPFDQKGIDDAEEMARLAANHAGIDDQHMAVASTGVTGVYLPLEKVEAGIPRIVLTPDGGPDFALAIMTTDTKPKSCAVAVKEGGLTLFTVGGCAKGSGMIHPNMATMLSYITTDANVDAALLKELTREVADTTYNMMTVDGDTSCSDTLLIFANGASGGPAITKGSAQAGTLREALLAVGTELSRMLARDGEGASHLITVEVVNGPTLADARNVARTVALSSLVKTAVTGNDPNWGRILVAAGRSGSPVEVAKTSVRLQDVLIFDTGKVIEFDEADVSKRMEEDEVRIQIDLGLGEHSATAWGCDLTTDYVHINADYRT